MGKVYMTNNFRMDALGINLEFAELKISPVSIEEIRKVQVGDYYTDITDYYEQKLVECVTGIPVVVPVEHYISKIRVRSGDVIYLLQFIYTGNAKYHGRTIKTSCNYSASLNDPEFRDYTPYYRKIEVITKKGMNK